MIYFYEKIEEETYKPTSEYGGDMLGEFVIKECWNLSVVATVYKESIAKHIVDVLNKESKEKERKYRMKRFDPAI